MSSSGAVTLGEITDRLLRLEVACSGCNRRGRLNVAKLIEQPTGPLPGYRSFGLYWPLIAPTVALPRRFTNGAPSITRYSLPCRADKSPARASDPPNATAN